jgi:hypothetical protein
MRKKEIMNMIFAASMVAEGALTTEI